MSGSLKGVEGERGSNFTSNVVQKHSRLNLIVRGLLVVAVVAVYYKYYGPPKDFRCIKREELKEDKEKKGKRTVS